MYMKFVNMLLLICYTQNEQIWWFSTKFYQYSDDKIKNAVDSKRFLESNASSIAGTYFRLGQDRLRFLESRGSIRFEEPFSVNCPKLTRIFVLHYITFDIKKSLVSNGFSNECNAVFHSVFMQAIILIKKKS